MHSCDKYRISLIDNKCTSWSWSTIASVLKTELDQNPQEMKFLLQLVVHFPFPSLGFSDRPQQQKLLTNTLFSPCTANWGTHNRANDAGHCQSRDVHDFGPLIRTIHDGKCFHRDGGENVASKLSERIPGLLGLKHVTKALYHTMMGDQAYR